MLIQYGPFSLNCFEVHSFNREAVYIGRNYAYTKFVLAVRAVLNPGTQGDAFPSSPRISGGLLGPYVPPVLPNVRVPPIGPVIPGKWGGLGLAEMYRPFRPIQLYGTGSCSHASGSSFRWAAVLTSSVPCRALCAMRWAGLRRSMPTSCR